VNELVGEYMKVAFHSQAAGLGKAEPFSCDLDFDPRPGLKPIKGVRPEIGRALLNIIVNAFEAVQIKKEQGGLLYFPKVSIQTRPVESGVKITIWDNGHGIAPFDLPRVFDPFFTTKPPNKGTGLGLSLAYDTIVRKHNGQLTVESETGEWTQFVVVLPTH
jgi:two-component system, NtrC family, sensor kinase